MKEYRIKGQDSRPLKIREGDWYKVSFLLANDGWHEFIGMFDGNIKYQEPFDSFRLTNMISLTSMASLSEKPYPFNENLETMWVQGHSPIKPIDAAKAVLILNSRSHPGLDSFIQSAGHKLYEYNPQPNLNWIQSLVSEIFGIGEKIDRMLLEQAQFVKAAKINSPKKPHN